MANISDRSVDLILCDLPFGNSGFGWDRPIDLASLWQHYRQITKPNHTIVLFASQPFATDLVNAARDWFRCESIWMKSHPTGFNHAKNKPMKERENILVISPGTTMHKSRSKRRMPYYPQGLASNNRDRIVSFCQAETDSSAIGQAARNPTNSPDTRIQFSNFPSMYTAYIN